MDSKFLAKLLPFRKKEIRSPLERQHAGHSRSSSRTITPQPGSENVSARGDFNDDRHAQDSQRGHDYSNVQAQDYARMHLGDTYTAETMIFNQLRHPTGTEEDNKQIDLLDALAFEHKDTRLASISAAQGDTCRWLFQTEEYRDWRRGFRRSRRRFLWIKGKPGAGKSTMMRVALDQAARDFRRSIVARFFFSARGHSMGKSTQGMYRSLLHQIFSRLKQLPSGIPSSVAVSLKKHGWSIPVLQNMLRTVVLYLDQGKSLVCYIDALDECAEDDIREAIHHFEELASLAMARDTKFLICFASRHYPTITIRHHQEIDLDKQSGHQKDISDYVSGALRVSGSLGVELQRSISDRSAGVFLWAVLTVRILNKLNDHGDTRAQLRAQLSEVPLGVQSLFSAILQERDVYLLPTLQWVLFAQIPLTVSELYCAILTSVEVQPTGVWEDIGSDQERMRRFILASSKGLVDFSDSSPRIMWRMGRDAVSDDRTTQLIHESLREYLLQSGLAELDPSLQGSNNAIIHARLAETCLTYISNLELGYVTGKGYSPAYSFLGHATCATVPYMNIAFINNALSRGVLRRFACLWLTSKLVIGSPFSFKSEHCAAMLCLSLAKTCRQISTDDRRGVLDALTLTSEEFSVAALCREPLPTRSCHRWNHEERKKLPLFQAAVDAESVDVLQLARRQGWKRLFAFLLRDAPITASALGLADVLSLLLECVAGATASHSYDRDMLECAVVNLEERTTKFLLRRGVKPHNSLITLMANGDSWNEQTDGTEEACVRMVTTLLDAGLDVRGRRFKKCRIQKPEVIEQLRIRGAEILYCTRARDVSTGTCFHGNPVTMRP